MRKRTLSTVVAVAALVAAPTLLIAQDIVTCESKDYKYQYCNVGSHGYISLVRELSRGNLCEKGRTWDWNRRGIWVDDGCRAEFRVNSHHSYNRYDDDDDDAKKVAGVIAGAAILGAILENRNHKDDHKYSDDSYYGPRHSSYVPSWVVGTFRGYNPRFGQQVTLTIERDGQARARVDGETIRGYYNDERLHMGGAIFDVDQEYHGFVTSQVGTRRNAVHYHRVD